MIYTILNHLACLYVRNGGVIACDKLIREIFKMLRIVLSGSAGGNSKVKEKEKQNDGNNNNDGEFSDLLLALFSLFGRLTMKLYFQDEEIGDEQQNNVEQALVGAYGQPAGDFNHKGYQDTNLSQLA